MEKTKGKKILLIIIILLMLILIVAGGAYAYIATDLLKTPEQLFKKYLIKGAQEISKFNTEPYGEVFKKMKTEPVEISINSDLKAQLPYNTNAEEEGESSEKQSLKISLITDLANNGLSFLIDMKKEDKDIFGAEFAISNNIYGIHVDGLHDKYIAVENRDFKKIAKTFGASEETINKIPDSLPELKTLSGEENVKLVKVILKHLNNEMEKVEANSYSKEEYTIDDLDGEKVEGTKYSLTMQSSQYSDIIMNTTKALVEDEEFTNLVNKSIVENLKEQINNEESLEKEENNDNSNITISLYTSNGKTVKLDAVSDTTESFEFYIINKDNSSHIQLKSNYAKTESNEVAYENIVNITNTFENNSGELNIESKTTYDKSDIEALNENSDTFFNTKVYEDNSTSLKFKSNIENGVITSKCTYKLGDSSKEEAKYTIKSGSDVKVTSLNKDNAIIVNDYSQEEFANLGQEIIMNLMQYAMANPDSLIGSIGSIANNFTNNPVMTDTELPSDIDMYTDSNNNGNVTISYNSSSISESKEIVNLQVSSAIKSLLEDYHRDLANNQSPNPGDYLTADKIEDELLGSITNLEIVDGNTLKCEYQDSIFFVKININGDTWELDGAETLYSEDGTLENAE